MELEKKNLPNLSRAEFRQSLHLTSEVVVVACSLHNEGERGDSVEKVGRFSEENVAKMCVRLVKR